MSYSQIAKGLKSRGTFTLETRDLRPKETEDFSSSDLVARGLKKRQAQQDAFNQKSTPNASGYAISDGQLLSRIEDMISAPDTPPEKIDGLVMHAKQLKDKHAEHINNSTNIDLSNQSPEDTQNA